MNSANTAAPLPVIADDPATEARICGNLWGSAPVQLDADTWQVAAPYGVLRITARVPSLPPCVCCGERGATVGDVCKDCAERYPVDGDEDEVAA